MRTQFILITCLAIARQARGTRVYEDAEQDKYHPVTFEASDAQKEKREELYNLNIQTGGSGVASALAQQSVRVTVIIK
jgi:hypothetical protein